MCVLSVLSNILAYHSLTLVPQTNGSEIWKQRTEDLLNATINVFFPGNIAFEVACEEHMSCTTDMLSFKGYLHRWMATTGQIAPFTHDRIMQVLQTSTQAAVSQCTGGTNGRVCGFKWSTKTYDGTQGAGQQMNVLAAVSSLLIDQAGAPVTNSTGGTSAGNPNAGSQSDSFNGHVTPPSSADKAGAGILTFVILGMAVGTFGWMSTGV
jgi:mannan endo-1,6-alpha-mannosidase